MIGLALFLSISQAPMTLQYYQGTFLIQDGAIVLPAAVQAPPPPREFARYRRGDVYAVWDQRGLSIRAKNWIYDTKLKELATSPKVFSKDTIQANLAKFKRGERTLEASALAGSLRLGTDVFFLPRWIDKKGFTWLEALVKVDLSAEKPKPQYLGKFDGTSLASGTIDHRLFPLNEQPAVIVRRAGEWGVASFDPLAQEFNYTNLGERLRAYALLETNTAAYVEVESDGMMRLGVADLESGSRNDMVEDRGTIRVLDDQRPLCALVVTPERTTLRNLQTSAALDLPADSAVQRTALGVLVYWPAKQPRHAVLLDPDRWEGLANWQAPATPPSGSSPPPSPASKPSGQGSPPPTGRPPAQSRKQPPP